MNSFSNSLRERRYGRRKFVTRSAGLMVGGAAFALVGCGGDDDDGDAGAGTPAAASPIASPTAPEIARGGGAPFQPDGAKPGGVLTFLTASEPPYLDPHRASSVQMPFVTQGYARLIHKNASGDEVINEVAESWEQPDDTSYVFSLRQGARFHSGDVLTAEDVVFSLERFGQLNVADPDPNMAWTWMMADVASVEAVDPSTVRITTTAPSAPLLSYLGVQYNGIVNKAFTMSHDLNSEMNGLGPFKLREWKRSQEVSMERHPDYFWAGDGLPYLDGFRAIISPDTGTNDAAFVAGQTLGAFPSGLSGKATALRTYQAQIPDLQYAEGDATFWSYFEMNKLKPGWSDPRVRRAVQLAINQVEIAGRALDGEFALAGPVAAGFPFYSLPQDEVAAMPGFRPEKEEDIAEAKRLLEAAGYGPDNPLRGVNITTPLHPYYYPFSLAIQENLAAVDIDLEIKEFPDYASLIQARAERNFDTHAWSRGGPDDVDQYFGESFPSDSPLNFGGWDDPRTDELIEQQRRTLDPDERQAVVYELSRYFMTEAHPQAFVPTLHGYSWWREPYHVAPSLVTPSYTAFFGQFTWLDPVPSNMESFSSF